MPTEPFDLVEVVLEKADKIWKISIGFPLEGLITRNMRREIGLMAVLEDINANA